MYAMCDKFEMHGMKKVASQKFTRAILEPLLPTVDHNPGKLTQILSAIPIIYDTTPDQDISLRGVVTCYVAAAWRHFTALPQFKTFITENPEFFVDVFDKRESLLAAKAAVEDTQEN